MMGLFMLMVSTAIGLSAQEGFNKRLYHGIGKYGDSRVNSILVTDSCIYTIGQYSRQTSQTHKFPSICVSSHDLEGNIKWVSYFPDTSIYEWVLGPDGLHNSGDTALIFGATGYLAVDLIQFDLRTKKFSVHRLEPQSEGVVFFSLRDVKRIEEDLYLAGISNQSRGSEGRTQLDPHIVLFNSKLEILSRKTIKLDTKYSEVFLTAIPEGDNIQLWFSSTNVGSQSSEAVFFPSYMKVDKRSLDVLEWLQWTALGEPVHMLHGVKEEGGGDYYLAGSRIRKESGERYYKRPYIIKLDSNLQIEWTRKVVIGEEDLNRTGFERVIPAVDGDGVVAIGQVALVDTDQDTCVCPERLDLRGLAVHYNSEGEVKWQRIFHVLDSTYEHHLFYDIQHSIDGGYLIGGSANEGTLNEKTAPAFQSWLLKIDADGCIVPGCGESTFVRDTKDPLSHIMVYPNPVSDILQVHQTKSEAYRFVLMDMQGRALIEFDGRMADEIHLVPVSDIPGGIYQLAVYGKSGLLGVKTILKL